MQTLDWYYVGTMSDWYKRWTGTNVRLVQRSEWYKPWTRTDIRLVQTSDWYKCIFIELSSVCNYLSLNWKCFNYGFMYSKQKLGTYLVFDSPTTSNTSNDLKWPPKWKCLNYGFMYIEYQTKARNSENIVAATNLAFDPLIISNKL